MKKAISRSSEIPFSPFPTSRSRALKKCSPSNHQCSGLPAPVVLPYFRFVLAGRRAGSGISTPMEPSDRLGTTSPHPRLPCSP